MVNRFALLCFTLLVGPAAASPLWDTNLLNASCGGERRCAEGKESAVRLLPEVEAIVGAASSLFHLLDPMDVTAWQSHIWEERVWGGELADTVGFIAAEAPPAIVIEAPDVFAGISWDRERFSGRKETAKTVTVGSIAYIPPRP